MMQETTS